MDSNEENVPGLKSSVVRRITADQVIVQVYHANDLAASLNLNPAQRSIVVRTSRRIERSQHSADARNLITSRIKNFANHEDLIRMDARNSDVESSSRVR
jgi:hypothetical protein